MIRCIHAQEWRPMIMGSPFRSSAKSCAAMRMVLQATSVRNRAEYMRRKCPETCYASLFPLDPELCRKQVSRCTSESTGIQSSQRLASRVSTDYHASHALCFQRSSPCDFTSLVHLRPTSFPSVMRGTAMCVPGSVCPSGGACFHDVPDELAINPSVAVTPRGI